MAEEQKTKKKKPTALKRITQSNKKNEANRQYKSKAKTAIKDFKSSIEKKENIDLLNTKLNVIFSIMDKGVKRNIFTKNKASRIKSTLSSAI
ncbi:MAG: 30S ribosomal protein S20 [Chlamydiae bacterium RIFCSPHIGHO2_12_FULL_27_8]|nr:MAG: 30S ribosomal protein S20 [Chlamydiae bacterium RIFCSPHIGHO2_12_FULL_27_8]